MRKSAAPPPPIQGLDAPVELRRHPRARRLTLRVSRTRRTVVVTMPLGCDPGEADSLIHRNLAWVRERLGALPALVAFEDGVLIPLRGVMHKVVFQGGRVRRRGAVVARCGLAYPELHVSGEVKHAARRLREWLFNEARHDLDARVRVHAHRLGLAARKIAIRDQKSRWGSCSTTGVLSFSWRLVLAPSFVLDYVAAHEAAHLAEMNHGPRFWALVRRLAPRVVEAKRWLQVFGLDLYRYGPTARA